MLYDFLPVNRMNAGWFNFKYDGEEYPVYLHSPWEIKKLISDSGLEVHDFYSVNYYDGNIFRKNNYFGQLVFILKRHELV